MPINGTLSLETAYVSSLHTIAEGITGASSISVPHWNGPIEGDGYYLPRIDFSMFGYGLTSINFTSTNNNQLIDLGATANWNLSEVILNNNDTVRNYTITAKLGTTGVESGRAIRISFGATYFGNLGATAFNAAYVKTDGSVLSYIRGGHTVVDGSSRVYVGKSTVIAVFTGISWRIISRLQTY